MVVITEFAFFAACGVFGMAIGYIFGQVRGHDQGWDACDYQRDHAEALEINAEVDAERHRERNNAHGEA